MINQPIKLVREFNSDRDRIIYEIRENFRYVRDNGGNGYTYERLAEKVRECANVTWDKSAMRRFLEIEKGQKGYVAADTISPESLTKLLQLSIDLRSEVEPHVKKAMEMIATEQRRLSRG